MCIFAEVCANSVLEVCLLLGSTVHYMTQLTKPLQMALKKYTCSKFSIAMENKVAVIILESCYYIQSWFHGIFCNKSDSSLGLGNAAM